MIKAIEFPNKEFETKEELFAALKKDYNKLIELKKATIKMSDPFESDINTSVVKSMNYQDGYIYPVINTTNYLDSHNDVHIDGIWNRSSEDQKGKVMYIINHQLEVGKVISYAKDVEIEIKTLNWNDLGREYTGQTQALIFKTKLFDYSNEDAAKIIKAKIPIENSVRMQYVKVDMAINSDDPDYKDEKAIWLKHINNIANKGKAIEQGYFWAVSEAKIWKEGSMVLAGSNDATPILYPKQEIDTKALIEQLEEIKQISTNNLVIENLSIFAKNLQAQFNNEPLEALKKELPPKTQVYIPRRLF